MQLLPIALASIALSSAALADNTVKDDQSVPAYQNTGSGDHTVQISNTSTNGETLTAVVYDKDENILGWITIEAGGSNPVTVPKGGHANVDDHDYTGKQTAPTVKDDAGSGGGKFTVN
ncbi:MAG: hypothetical protein K8S98_09355 [Planctomycetes bacterium]|nr:hypothetical protein [Planctomycetota bacterium]